MDLEDIGIMVIWTLSLGINISVSIFLICKGGSPSII